MPRLERDYRRFLPLPVVRPARGALSGPSGLSASLETTFRALKSPTTQREILGRLSRPSGLTGLLRDLQRLARVSDDSADMGPTIVICLDQAEELATVEGRAEAETLMAMLADGLNSPPASHGARAAHPLAIIVVGIRSDSFERFQVEPTVQRVQCRLFNLSPIPPSEFKSIIEGPAARSTAAGTKLVLEPALTERLLKETEGQDALPLLAFTLERLYVDHGVDGDLLLSEYEAMGGVRGSLEAAVAAAFADPHREPAIPGDKLERENRLRRAFIPWLAMIDPETGERRRRAARWDELPADAHALLDRMIDARLLVRDVRRLDDGDHDAVVIEVTHEALLRQWPPLVTWLDADADALKALDAARRAASEWHRNARADGWLTHSNERLNSAETLRKRSDFSRLLGTDGAQYLEACRARDDAVREEREGQTRRVARGQRWATVLLAGIAMVLAVAGARTVTQAREVGRQIALALAIEAERANDVGLFGRGLRLGILAARKTWLSPSVPQAEAQLARAAFASRQIALFRHESPVRVALFSPDDTRVVTASSNGVTKIWDAASGNQIAELSNAGALVSALFSPDGRRLLTLDFEDDPLLWDMATGKQITALPHGDRVFAAAFSHDGQRIVSGGNEPTVHIWDGVTGGELARVQQGDSALRTVFSPDGSRVAAASNDSNAYMWASDTGAELLRLKHDESVNAIGFSVDGQLLATGSGSLVHVWRSNSGEEAGRIFNLEPIQSVRFTPAGRLIVVGTTSVRIVDPLKSEVSVSVRHDGPLRSAVLSADGTRLVTASDDKSARVWAVGSGEQLVRLNHDGPVYAAAFDTAGRRVVTASDVGGRVWDVVDRRPVALQHGETVARVAFSPDGHSLATISAFNPGGHSLSTTPANTVRIWDVDTNKERLALTHLGPVQGIAFSADGERMLTWAHDRSVRVWDRAGGPVAMRVHDTIVWFAALSPDGRSVVSAGSSDRSSWVWDATTGKNVVELKVGSELTQVAFSADGKTIVTGSRDNSARLWDAVSGRMIVAMPHQAWVESAAFSPDLRRLVTGSLDFHVRVWNVADGAEMARLRHDDSVYQAVFSPDGRYVLVGLLRQHGTAVGRHVRQGTVPLPSRNEISGDRESALQSRWQSHRDVLGRRKRSHLGHGHRKGTRATASRRKCPVSWIQRRPSSDWLGRQDGARLEHPLSFAARQRADRVSMRPAVDCGAPSDAGGRGDGSAAQRPCRQRCLSRMNAEPMPGNWNDTIQARSALEPL